MNRALFILPLWFVAMYCDCTMAPLAGGSSQQGNGVIVGRVILPNGSGARATHIRVRPSGYVQAPGAAVNSSGKIDATTDSTGHFSVSGIIPGSYTIEANDREFSVALIKTTVEEPNGRTDAGTATLKPYARIIGVVSAAAMPPNCQLSVQVRGLERLARVGQDGTFAIVDLPEGNFDLRLVAGDSTVAPVEFFGVNARSDATESVVIPDGCRYARRLFLNTAGSGADVAGDVTGFPVLVRLTEENFDFGLAKGNGADIRFAKADNTSLPHEIERWDASNRRAEVWVKVDTVYGNGTQSLTMCWGVTSGAGSSNSTAVFDTSDGFAGVWHLGENGDSVSDATGNAHGGMNSGSATAEGIIGNSKKMANGNYIRISGLLGSPSDVTLSAWVRSDTSKKAQDVISIGDAVLIRIDDVLGMGTSGCYHDTSFISDTSYAKVTTGRYLAKTGWHYVAFSINTATHTQTVYIDGVPSAISNGVNPIDYAGLGTDTYIGKHGNGKSFQFIGQIDEVRVGNTAVSPDWIKLCFMNQKAQDALVQW